MIRTLASAAAGLLVLSAAAFASSPWLRPLPGGGRSGCCYGLGVDADANVWFTAALRDGHTLDGVPLSGAGGSDVFVAKIDSTGHALWVRMHGGPGQDFPVELAVTPQGAAYVVSMIEADARFGEHFLPGIGRMESVLARYSPDGRCEWAQKVPGSGEESVKDVAVDGRGAAVVAGTHVRQFSKGDRPEVYLAKYRSNGDRQWMRRAEGTGRAVSVAVADGGVVYLAGATPASENIGSRYPLDGWPLVQSFEENGGFRWRWEPERPPGKPGSRESRARPVAVAAAPDGGCWVLGEFRGPGGREDLDVFLVRLSTSGELLWRVRAGGPEEETALDLAAGANGGCVISGTFGGTASFDPWELSSSGRSDAFVAEYDAGGTCRWVLTGSGPGEDVQEVLPYEVAAAPDGTVWSAGWYRAAVRFGSLQIPGPHDGQFLVRILPGGRTR